MQMELLVKRVSLMSFQKHMLEDKLESPEQGITFSSYATT